MNSIGLIGLICHLATIAAPPDPFAGDPRMAAKHTIRVHDQPVADLLADLNQQTGIRFFAQGGVSDDRVTVFAHDRPLADTLKAVADLYHDEWKRENDSADRGYILTASPAQAVKEDQARLARIGEVADAILYEIKMFDQ